MNADKSTSLNKNVLFRRGLAYLIDCAVAFCIFALTQILFFWPLRTVWGIDQEWFRSGFNTQLYTLFTISIPVWLYFFAYGIFSVASDRGQTLGLSPSG